MTRPWLPCLMIQTTKTTVMAVHTAAIIDAMKTIETDTMEETITPNHMIVVPSPSWDLEQPL